MYLNATTISPPALYSPITLQRPELNNGQQQTPVHYNIININGHPVAGLIGPISSMTTNSPITMNVNGLSGSAQLSGQTNDLLSQQAQTSISSSSSTSTINSSISQQSQLNEQFHGVVLREKNTNSINESKRIRKRMSDPVYSYDSQILGLNQQKYFTPINQEKSPGNVHLTRDSSTVSLSRRRSLRMTKASLVLQPIPQQSSPINVREPQKLFVVRHAERVDSTFGSGWIDQAFDKTTGLYRRFNLNLPKKMVTRRDLKDFLFDPPITELGLHESKMIGEELAAQGIRIDHVYASPALRCVQTADKILEGLQMRDEISIRIEPCLFEFLKWYPVVPVKWPFLHLDELIKNGFNVDLNYRPFYPIESLRKDEDESMYYGRSHFIVTSILKNHGNNGGNVLIVGHAPSIEVCTRQLIGGQPRINELKFLVLRVPYLSMHSIAKQSDGTWKPVKSSIPPIKRSNIEPFDWRFFR